MVAARLLGSLALCAAGAGAQHAGDDAWINAPRSGSILTHHRVDVALALRPGAKASARVACLTTEQLDVDAPSRTRDCFEVTVHGANATLEAGASVNLRPHGHWFKIELELRAAGSIVSTFAVAVYVAAPRTSMDKTPVGLAWDWGGGIGWGVAGLHIALALARDASMVPVPLGRAHLFEVPSTQRQLLRPSLDAAAFLNATDRYDDLHISRGARLPFPIVHALGRWGANGSLNSMDVGCWSSQRNVGILFAETESWNEEDLEALRRYDEILVGSTWLREAILKSGEKLPPVQVFVQGVSTNFRPSSALIRHPGDPFRVFSGGKLEWRKGQDVVVEAFKRFVERHPEANAQLVCAWSNAWRQTTLTMLNATHTRGVPRETPRQALEEITVGPLPKSDADHEEEREALVDWLVDNGVQREAIAALPPLQHGDVPGVLRKMDAALFPNRCEGGTNLVAMEALAAGVPTILTDGTGQRDTVRLAGGGCWPLAAVPAMNGPLDAAGVEPSPEAAADMLAAIYLDSHGARRRALAGAGRLREWTWGRAVGVIVEAVLA